MKSPIAPSLASSIKYSAFAILLALGVVAASRTQAEPPAAAVTMQRPVTAFQSIELDGPYRVLIKAQGTPGVTLSGNPRQLANIQTRVSGDTLIVGRLERSGFGLHFGGHRDEILITITTPTLKSLKHSGSGDVAFEQLDGDALSIHNSGPGDITGSGTVRELTVSSSGPGDVDLRSLAATNATVRMTGPGDVALPRALVRLDGELRGPGDLEADGLRAESVRLTISGPGDASLDGEAATLTAELTGSGGLDAARLKVVNATVRSRGPGEIELDTVTGVLDADLRGSGSLDARMAGQRFALNISGPGDADITGTVDLINAQLSGSGSLEGQGLTAGKADVVVRGPGSAEVRVQPTGDASTAALDQAQILRFDRNGTRQSQH